MFQTFWFFASYRKWFDLTPGALISFRYLKGGRLFGKGRLFGFFSATTERSEQNFNVY